ncbi:prolipoprotein diacylglyceryl transferase family protein [Luteitalea sp.]|uniref:prolipoprotein diacylglyceryl transferase family protein n=1 Tax=Luteitalea sp. TaxID=2004800 RepID=UPI0025C63119|nr:prolipoprotein diacylglyceryl transferase family protein [Luteitalea sp.]
MRLDPFRIQILTLSLDSQIVLTLVGLVIAGVVFRQSARQAGFGLSTSHWWDLVFAAVVGGRLIWVVTHAEYYLRQPLQIVVILDGGLHAVGLALGAACWSWRFSRTGDAPPWRSVVDLVAIGILTTYLFERVGCALTTCGTGPASELPWAILRGDEWHTPMALEQVIVLAVVLIVAAETLRVRGAVFITILAAFTLAEGIAFVDGRPSVEGLVALAALLMMYLLTSWYRPASAWKGAPGHSSPS